MLLRECGRTIDKIRMEVSELYRTPFRVTAIQILMRVILQADRSGSVHSSVSHAPMHTSLCTAWMSRVPKHFSKTSHDVRHQVCHKYVACRCVLFTNVFCLQHPHANASECGQAGHITVKKHIFTFWPESVFCNLRTSLLLAKGSCVNWANP